MLNCFSNTWIKLHSYEQCAQVPLRCVFLKSEAVNLNFWIVTQVDVVIVSPWGRNQPSPGYCWVGIFAYVYSLFRFPSLKCLFKSLAHFLAGIVFHRHCFPSPSSRALFGSCVTSVFSWYVPFVYFLLTFFFMSFDDWKHLFSRLVFMLFPPRSPDFIILNISWTST